MSRSLWPDLTWRRAEHMQVIKAMWAKRVSKKVRVLKSISHKQKFLCAPFYFVASKQRAAVAESRSCDRGPAADIFSASRPAASTDESHMQNVCKLHICSFFSCNKPLLWIIVTEWELELGFHRSNTVHQFFANPSLTLESAIHLQAAAVSRVCGARPWWRWQCIPANIDCSHLASGRDHADTGTVSPHSLGVLKLLSNLFDDCNFLIWKGRWYRTCEKLAVWKLKFRPSARCQ